MPFPHKPAAEARQVRQRIAQEHAAQTVRILPSDDQRTRRFVPCHPL